MFFSYLLSLSGLINTKHHFTATKRSLNNIHDDLDLNVVATRDRALSFFLGRGIF